jgi:branched-subunit amino acid aminotransferase/4-amino-4-deoxychorismate lyase
MAGNEGWAVVDGRGTPLTEAALPITDPGYLSGWVAFETVEVTEGSDPAPNLARLARSAEALQIPHPGDAVLREELEQVRQRVGGRAWVRIDLTGGGRRLVWGTPIDPTRWYRGLVAARVPHVDHPWLSGEVKHRSRAPWAAEVRRRNVDEILFVDAAGRFTEGSTCAVVATVGGALVTAPWDGRILASTTLVTVLAQAESLGIPIRREGPLASGPWDALYVVSTTRWLAPVTSLDGQALPGWDPVGRAIVSSRRSP